MQKSHEARFNVVYGKELLGLGGSRKRPMNNRTALFTAMALLALCGAASAQQRTPNTQNILRVWPHTGVWQVVLIRLVDGALGCLLGTSHVDKTTGESYSWGIRWRYESVGAWISDSNENAVAGATLQIVIDHIPAGSYQINHRINKGGFHNVTAELSDKDRLLKLINVGGTMQFVTSAFTYGAPLQGASQGLQNLNACSIEATQLGDAPMDAD